MRNSIVNTLFLFFQVPVRGAQHVARYTSQQPEDRVCAVPRVGRRGIASGRRRGCRKGRRCRQTSVALLHRAVRAADVKIRAVRRISATCVVFRSVYRETGIRPRAPLVHRQMMGKYLPFFRCCQEALLLFSLCLVSL